ncbi:DUF2802 domain-containing protein [Thioalkalivibrio sulfidiphilus]|uniref:DUF2802 domain-containing protein n=1 Tax=Thioalkalivibrio sulfidiphilus (strain HL-EbGR7) TaxID=396588 RepID=B8GR14_THISH|nr:DUF2802 domain-containing protein [Thioalkalivibrio sulfidiphilus]ACL72434.1 conserved hypothetical protein [Thioalkalivibrio sulfidiphilus HL-EbGr7]
MSTPLMLVAVAALICAAMAAGIALWAMARVRRLGRRVMIQETALLSLRGALSAVCSSEMATDQRQAEVERRLRQLAEQQEQLLLRDPDQGPYQHAMRLATQGASREELMKTCGLTRGEADLLLALHGGSGVARKG